MQFLPSFWLAAWTGVWAWLYWRLLQQRRWSLATVRIEGHDKFGGEPLLKLRVLDGPFIQAKSEMYLTENTDLAHFPEGRELLVRIRPKDGAKSVESPTVRDLYITGFVFTGSLGLTAFSVYLYL